MAVIYKITNTLNGKGYVGFTTNFRSRKRQHLNDARNRSTNPIHNAIRKYGEDVFTWEIIFEDATLDDEIRLIAEHGTHKTVNGYNVTLGGEGTLGYIPDVETRRKMSEARKGIPKSEEWKAKRRGKKLTDTTNCKGPKSLQHRLNMRKPKSDAHKEKIRQSKLGVKRDPVVMEKVAATKRKNYWIIHPDGHEEYVHGLCGFCKKHNLHDAGFAAVLRGRCHHYKGYKIRRAEENAAQPN